MPIQLRERKIPRSELDSGSPYLELRSEITDQGDSAPNCVSALGSGVTEAAR
jgi:hypothetical protein